MMQSYICRRLCKAGPTRLLFAKARFNKDDVLYYLKGNVPEARSLPKRYGPELRSDEMKIPFSRPPV